MDKVHIYPGICMTIFTFSKNTKQANSIVKEFKGEIEYFLK